MTEVARVRNQLSHLGPSACRHYSSVAVGRPGLRALLSYELTVLASQAVPGAIGLALRRALYPRLLDACGRRVVFGQNVVLRHPHKIRIGDDVVIDDNCLLDATGDADAGIVVGNGSCLGRNTVLSCRNGRIELGDGANLGFSCGIFSASRVTIGANALFAAYCYVIGGDPDRTEAPPSGSLQPGRSRGVIVGTDVWMGAGVKVMDGVSIGAGAMIGAGAVVRDDVPERAVAVGIPARVVGTREMQE